MDTDKQIKLDLGSGFVRQGTEWTTIDLSPKCNPDYVWDIRNTPYPEEWAPENGVDYIRADNLFEHIEPYTLIKVIQELHRILKVGGILWIRVPNVNIIEAAFTDPTHVNYFHPNTFDYYDKNHARNRWKEYGQLYGIPPFKRIRQVEVTKFIIVELKKIE